MKTLHNNLITEARERAEYEATLRRTADYMYRTLCGPTHIWVESHCFGEYVVLVTPRQRILTKIDDYQRIVDDMLRMKMAGVEMPDQPFDLFQRALRTLRKDGNLIWLRAIPGAIYESDDAGDLKDLVAVTNQVTAHQWVDMLELLKLERTPVPMAN